MKIYYCKKCKNRVHSMIIRNRKNDTGKVKEIVLGYFCTHCYAFLLEYEATNDLKLVTKETEFKDNK